MLKETEALLTQFSLDVISKVKATAPVSSGALKDSLDYEIVITDDTIAVEFLAEDYGTFQDKGVQGKDPSKIKGGYQKAPNSPYKFGSGSGSNGTLRGGIDKWVIRKGLTGIRNKKGQFVKRKSLVYAISKSIYFTGLRPTLFFTKPFEREQRKLKRGLEKALALDYENEIKIRLIDNNITVV